MRLRLRIRCFVVVAAIAISPTPSLAVDPDFIPITTETGAIPAISKCLRKDKEAVLLPNGVQCKDYRQGADFLNITAPNAPFDFDANRDCPTNLPRPPNPRRLSGDAIQQLMNELKSNVPSFGIRILGAIFCTRLTLVGLDLPFSLVLDKSVFADGVEFQNLHIKGDLSFDRSLILNRFRLSRSHIEGSVFGNDAFIRKVSIGSSTVDTSVSFARSVLLDSTQIHNSSIANELSVRGSLLSYFIVQFSKIGEILDLSHSEARCAYHINKSEIGYLVARRTGFGTVDPPKESEDIYVWRGDFSPSIDHILSIPEMINRIAKADTCVNQFKRTYRAEFFIFDSKITSSLCVTDFQWLSPRDEGSYKYDEFTAPHEGTANYLRTVIAINGNTIGNNLIIDLWPTPTGGKNLDYNVSERLHKLEVIGVKAGGLIIDFQDKNQDHVTTAVDGLDFDRVYDAEASCEYGGSKSRIGPFVEDAIYTEIISDFTQALKLPKVDDALKWLDLNKIASSQPYTAFATAFSNAGVDSTDVTIARENRVLCDRAARWLPLMILRPFCKAIQPHESSSPDDESSAVIEVKHPDDQQGGWTQLGITLSSIPRQLSDLAQLGFRGALYFLAEHGYRPGKVLWWVTLTLIVFWFWFIWFLKVVAYSSKTDPPRPENSPPRLRPLGVLFLFDRLLPAYQIDSAHYEIESYFKRVPVSQIAGRPALPVIRRLGLFEWPVERVTEQRDKDRIEGSLRILRILGVVFAIFLAAAVSALVTH